MRKTILFPLSLLPLLLSHVPSLGFVLMSSSASSSASSTKELEVGVGHRYEYSLALELTEPYNYNSTAALGWMIRAGIRLGVLWTGNDGEGILGLELIDLSLQVKKEGSFQEHSSGLDELSTPPIYLHWKNGEIVTIYSTERDELVGLKRGVANLLQLRDTSRSEETTPAGLCRVKYTVTDAFNLAKRLTCYDSVESILGTRVKSEIYATIAISKHPGIVGDVEALETLVLNSVGEVGAVVSTFQSLKLVDSSPAEKIEAKDFKVAIKNVEKLKKIKLKPDSLVKKDLSYCDLKGCRSVKTLLDSLSLENTVGTAKQASVFIQLVSIFKTTPPKEQYLQLDNPYFPTVLDACAASNSIKTHEAVMKIDFQDHPHLFERYLLGLALSPHPNPQITQNILHLTKNSPTRNEALILTLASLASKLPTSHISLESEQYLLMSLKSCDTEPCKQTFLRSLKNLKSLSTLPVLFEYLDSSNEDTSLTSMKSIYSFKVPSSYRDKLVRVILQIGKRYGVSVRTIATEIVLRDFEDFDLGEVFQFLLRNVGEKDHGEVVAFLLSRVGEMRGELGVWLKGLQNYHHMAPKGLTTSFTRNFTNFSHFYNSIEMEGKMFKRSLFQVKLNEAELFSLSIFTSNLNAFTEDNPSEPTAGMELSFLGVQNRPLVFFTGKGELMGLVWSGAGSERTTAASGNLLLQEEFSSLGLFSGLVAEVGVVGGVSYELAGNVVVSLWQRDAKSLVESGAGVLLNAILRIDNSFIKSRLDYTLSSQASLHFTSDINFYDGVKMCLKLEQPPFLIKKSISKSERIPGSKHQLRRSTIKRLRVEGVSYALDRRNAESCGKV